jgi:hypothetical protein
VTRSITSTLSSADSLPASPIMPRIVRPVAPFGPRRSRPSGRCCRGRARRRAGRGCGDGEDAAGGFIEHLGVLRVCGSGRGRCGRAPWSRGLAGVDDGQAVARLPACSGTAPCRRSRGSGHRRRPCRAGRGPCDHARAVRPGRPGRRRRGSAPGRRRADPDPHRAEGCAGGAGSRPGRIAMTPKRWPSVSAVDGAFLDAEHGSCGPVAQRVEAGVAETGDDIARGIRLERAAAPASGRWFRRPAPGFRCRAALGQRQAGDRGRAFGHAQAGRGPRRCRRSRLRGIGVDDVEPARIMQALASPAGSRPGSPRGR